MVTALTLAVIGVVLVAMTPIGCGPANALKIKSISNRCVSWQTGGVVTTPTPTPTTFFGPTATPTFEPYTPPASPPYTPPASGPFPPDSGPASGAYPPFIPPASGSGGSTVPGLALNCRLPVYVGPPGSGGFIVFPGGNFIADPASAVTIPSPSPGESPPPQAVGPGPGYGYGYPGLSYDRAHSRWLPVPPNWASPDGSRYVHPSTDAMYVENVVTGATTELGRGHSWAVAGLTDQGVYATIVNQAGLWLLPYSGPAKQITTSGFWQFASAAGGFGTVTSAVPQGVANTIIRVDVNTGAISDWFTRRGAQSFVNGLDARGYPLIQVNYFGQGQGNETWDATGPGTAVPIFSSNQGLNQSGQPLADSHGVWFPMYYNSSFGQSTQGIALYVAGSGLYWMSSLGAQLGGACS